MLIPERIWSWIISIWNKWLSLLVCHFFLESLQLAKSQWQDVKKHNDEQIVLNITQLFTWSAYLTQWAFWCMEISEWVDLENSKLPLFTALCSERSQNLTKLLRLMKRLLCFGLLWNIQWRSRHNSLRNELQLISMHQLKKCHASLHTGQAGPSKQPLSGVETCPPSTWFEPMVVGWHTTWSST